MKTQTTSELLLLGLALAISLEVAALGDILSPPLNSTFLDGLAGGLAGTIFAALAGGALGRFKTIFVYRYSYRGIWIASTILQLHGLFVLLRANSAGAKPGQLVICTLLTLFMAGIGLAALGSRPPELLARADELRVEAAARVR